MLWSAWIECTIPSVRVEESENNTHSIMDEVIKYGTQSSMFSNVNCFRPLNAGFCNGVFHLVVDKTAVPRKSVASKHGPGIGKSKTQSEYRVPIILGRILGTEEKKTEKYQAKP